MPDHISVLSITSLGSFQDPHLKTIYKLQEQLLEVTGSLTCLWSKPIRPNGKPTKVWLLQRDLVQVGSTSQAINI